MFLLASSYAENNIFKKHTNRISHQSRILKKNNTIKLLSTNINVPTISKYSFWDGSLAAWSPQSATRSVYLNDLLKIEYSLSYQLYDTFSKTEYFYDANKQVTQIINSYKDFNGMFIPSNRTTNEYFNNYLKVVTKNEYFDLQSQTWVPTGRYTQENNSRGDEIAYIQESYINGVWKIEYASQGSYTYLNSTSNKFTEYIYSNFDTTTLNYVPSYKDVINYNSIAQGVEWISYDYTAGSGYVPSFKDSIFYTNGIATSILEYGFDNFTNTFYKDIKFDGIVWEYFDPNSNLFSNDEVYGYTASSWVNNSWVLAERLITSFPDNFGSSIKTYEEYNNNSWLPMYQSKTLYDAKRNIIEESYADYIAMTNTWLITYGNRHSFLYDMSNNITEDIQEYYNGTIQVWEKNSRNEYFNYITISVGVNNELKTLNATIYPNPATTGTIYVDVNLEIASDLNINIIDLNGKIIHKKIDNLSKGLSTINLNDLSQGIYIIELITTYGSSKAKLIVN
jgi:hypothetical protein